MAVKRIGILTGGGDCPGLNGVIRAVTMRAVDYGWEVIGFRDGWRGVINNSTMRKPLGIPDVEDILWQGGTILGSSRTNPYKVDKKTKEWTRTKDVDKVLGTLEKRQIDALVAIGGDDTLSVAAKLFEEENVKTIGVPKTMDNDISETDYTFGYDTAVTIAVDALERLRDTARSHSRCIVLEVMGRHAGWVALATGIAGAADYILIPEVPKVPAGASKAKANQARQAELERMIEYIMRLRKRGQKYALVVASEGFQLPEPEESAQQGPKKVDAFGHELLKERGVGEQIADFIGAKTGMETRSVAIGHIQRGGAPTTFDRILSTRLGVAAADMVNDGKWGSMAALRGNRIVPVDIRKAVAKSKTVPADWYELARVFWK